MFQLVFLRLCFFNAFAGLSHKECGPLDSEAMVMGVLDKAFDVLILQYGVQKRIYCQVSSISSSETVPLIYWFIFRFSNCVLT